jgi:hypothetical protein
MCYLTISSTEDNPLPKELDRNQFFLGDVTNTNANSNFEFADFFENSHSSTSFHFFGLRIEMNQKDEVETFSRFNPL